MIKRWIKQIYAIEFLLFNVYNKTKEIPRKDCVCIAQSVLPIIRFADWLISIFRQIVQRGRGKAVALQGRIVQYASLAQHETCLLNNHVIICAKLERCKQDAYKIQ